MLRERTIITGFQFFVVVFRLFRPYHSPISSLQLVKYNILCSKHRFIMDKLIIFTIMLIIIELAHLKKFDFFLSVVVNLNCRIKQNILRDIPPNGHLCLMEMCFSMEHCCPLVCYFLVIEVFPSKRPIDVCWGQLLKKKWCSISYIL